jgi:hypothetical protein
MLLTNLWHVHLLSSLTIHISKYGFNPDYLVWRKHGEVDAPSESDIDEETN